MRGVGSSDSSASEPTAEEALQYADGLPADCWADRCIIELAAEVVRLRGEVAQLEKNCTQIYDAMKKAEAEAKFFRTLVQSHRA